MFLATLPRSCPVTSFWQFEIGHEWRIYTKNISKHFKPCLICNTTELCGLNDIIENTLNTTDLESVWCRWSFTVYGRKNCGTEISCLLMKSKTDTIHNCSCSFFRNKENRQKIWTEFYQRIHTGHKNMKKCPTVQILKEMQLKLHIYWWGKS